MERDLGSIYDDLRVLKSQELEECNEELSKGTYSKIVNKALMTYKHELLEILEMYDRYLDNKQESIR